MSIKGNPFPNKKPHPNSLANLTKKGHSQNFKCRLASQLNWETGCIKAMKQTVGRTILWAMANPEWETLTLERRTAVLEVRKEMRILLVQAQVVLDKIAKVKDTPLITPEAHQEALRRRRLRAKGHPVPK